MTSLLLIISFLLHLITLTVVYYLFQQIQEVKNAKSRDTEVLMSRFLDEIKQENRQLQQQLHVTSTKEANQTQSNETISHTKRKYPENRANTTNEDTTSFLPPLSTRKMDQVETSVEGQIFQLYQEGVSLEEIAKQMNRGKTEVELLIKFQEART